MEKSSTRIESCQSATLSPICLLVTPRALQFFFFNGTLILILAARLHGALSLGQPYSLGFVDIDGNKHSTADGHVTVIEMTTPPEKKKGTHGGGPRPRTLLGKPRLQDDHNYSFCQKTYWGWAKDRYSVHPAPR